MRACACTLNIWQRGTALQGAMRYLLRCEGGAIGAQFVQHVALNACLYGSCLLKQHVVVVFFLLFLPSTRQMLPVYQQIITDA